MGVFRRWGLPRVLVVLVLGAAACSNGKASPPGATVPEGDEPRTTSSSVTTVAEPASYEVPEVIDQAYVQRVVSAFDKVLGDAIRVLKRDGAVTDEFLKHLVAIYTEEEFEFAQRIWREEVAGGRVAKTRDGASNPITTVVSLTQADPRCVIIRAERDYRPTLNPGEEQVESQEEDYVVLVPKTATRDPGALNPTPWMMAFDGFKKDSTAPTEACVQ